MQLSQNEVTVDQGHPKSDGLCHYKRKERRCGYRDTDETKREESPLKMWAETGKMQVQSGKAKDDVRQSQEIGLGQALAPSLEKTPTL